MKPKASYYIFILFLFFGSLHAQKNSNIAYTQITEKYDDFKENNIQAFPFVNNLIGKAKREKNYRWMVTGYIDGIFYSPVISNKLKYADSAIWAAHLSQNATLISNSYLSKGTVYYFNLKKYQFALNEYLKAYEYSKKDIDEYEKSKIIYHLGVVKSYIGYYHEALIHFKKTSLFFESELKNKKLHPNEIYNNERGYYNSLHQMIICNRHLKRYKTADSLLNISINGTFGNNDYEYEQSYFYKETGIKEFREKEYSKAIVSLKRSLPHLIYYNDFAWVGISYFYIGKSYLKSNNTQKGIQYLQKVDSIFQKNSFILPELRENYELLINHYKREGNVERELYFTKQLLKADDFLSKDFTYLSSKIHKEYDTNTLLEEKLKLEKSSFQNRLALIGLGVFVLILIVLLVLKYRKEKENQIKYKILEQKILDKDKEQIINSTSKTREGYKSELDKNIVNDIFIKLKHFEDHCEFTESGLTLNKLATRFDTNSSYLSQIINEYKGTNFNRYLGELRIHYITNKLYNDRKFLNYKIETLAEECGIASRTNFSNLFQEINGIRPADFIKKRWEDINK